MLLNPEFKENLTDEIATPNLEMEREAASDLIEYLSKVFPQLVLGALFVSINCIIVSAMWRKRGKRLSNISLFTILASSVLFSLFPFFKPLRENGYCNTVLRCALYGMVNNLTVMYMVTSCLGVFLEMTHAFGILSPAHIHLRILLLSLLISLPGMFSYKMQIKENGKEDSAICNRFNILGSNILQVLYHIVFGFVAVIVPRIYIVYVWYRSGFKLKLLGIGKRFDGILARKVNQVRWTFLFTLCYFFLFVPAPFMKAILQPGITMNREESEGLEPWSFATLTAMYLQSLLQPILLLCTYSYVPFSQLFCCCKRVKKSVSFEMTFWTKRMENVTFEKV